MTSKSPVAHLVRRALARVPNLLVVIAVPAILALSAPAARAEFIALSATAFVKRCPCNVDDEPNEATGVLRPTVATRYFADVVFPTTGQRACAFRLVYRDVNNNENLTARLWRKPVVPGGSAFSGLVLMAKVNSAAGVVNTVRVAATTAINSPVINNFNAFYYVEIIAPTINLDILGVQIDVRPTCFS